MTHAEIRPTAASRIIVVGGGWAGLAAGIELSSRGMPVTLLESAKQLGGRARDVQLGDLHVDNGQHLLLGAYHHTLALLEKLGRRETDAFHRQPLDLRILHPDLPEVRLRAPWLPAPLHLAWGLLRCTGLDLRERGHALRLCLRLIRTGFSVAQDISVAQWLNYNSQPARVTRTLWEPLCLAALNTPIGQASAKIFMRVLRDSFARKRADSDLLLPRIGLGSILPLPGADYIRARGGRILLCTRVTGLRVSAGRLTGVETNQGEFSADQVILAVPPHVGHGLLKSHESLTGIARKLGRLDHQPIYTVYLRYPDNVRLGSHMLGLTGGVSQWVFDRSGTGQYGLMAVIISAQGAHETLEKGALATAVRNELHRSFPHWPPPLEIRVIREKRATFSCCVGAENNRPVNKTPVKGLWLGGDFTENPYPATLEGAVFSGLQCAWGVLSQEPWAKSM